jgi:hypothetical protein
LTATRPQPLNRRRKAPRPKSRSFSFTVDAGQTSVAVTHSDWRRGPCRSSLKVLTDAHTLPYCARGAQSKHKQAKNERQKSENQPHLIYFCFAANVTNSASFASRAELGTARGKISSSSGLITVQRRRRSCVVCTACAVLEFLHVALVSSVALTASKDTWSDRDSAS